MSHDAAIVATARTPKPGRAVRIGLALALLATIAGISVRAYDYHRVVKWTNAQVTPTVQLVTPEGGQGQASMTLPDRKSTRLNFSHITPSRMPSSA